ncbi:putative disease resistance RPP13-like protein 1 isoform X2 [Morus notabilis]|uniref:putative disease resistance RPP13-like protein 1 isoform X2 n=1 Tax=Morus notabilis TaxID=981085 RepID=UPI000CED5EBB|nr:putative disease resistance RPP13-like protein 1 isoform X2 [Morus notabilis]
MAELVGGAFLSAFLQVLFDRLASQEVVDFFRGKKLIVDQLKDLEIMLLSASAVLNDAEEKQMEDQNVRKWLDELKEVVYQADELVDKINTEALSRKVEGQSENNNMSKILMKLIPSSFTAFDKAVKSKIVEILHRLKLLLDRKEVLGLKAGVQSKLLQRLPAPLVEESGVYGRDVDKEAIIKLLLVDDVSGNEIPVIPIVGMGGIGKTTLAQIIFNDNRVKEYFELKAWVTVSHEFDTFKTMKTIYESVASQKCDIEDPYKLQFKLKEALEGKRFLFILDDIWNESYDSWNVLKSSFNFGANGSKIIVTTRSRTVALKMGNFPIHDLHVITDEDSWQLFAKHAFNGVDSDAYPDLQKIGREIVTKCKGLPLAIKSLAGLLRSVFDLEEWRKILKSDIWELHLQENGSSEILPVLWLSYHYLPSQLKRCFAYCSIFPKGYNYEKRRLILLWMAEGLLQSKAGRPMEDVAEEYIRALISRSLIQRSSSNESTLVMHDLVHDLATFVSGEFCLKLDENSLYNLTSKTRHLASVGGFELMKHADLSKAEFLRTFLLLQSLALQGIFLPSNHLVVDELLARTGRCLKALSLPLSFITELPTSIGNLKYLRYLDLSSTEIKEIPETLCTLYNLQTLLLAYCTNLTQLPMNLGSLINLRHLDISNTVSLKEMPPQICNLKELQTLTGFVLGRDGGSSIKELRRLQHLSRSLHIWGLENVVDVGDVLEANLEEKKLKELTLEWAISGTGADNSQKERQVLDALQPHTNLKQLSIHGYRGTRFSNWVGHHSFSDIVEVRLHYCKSCFFLPPFGQLPSLKKLEIWGCDSVMMVGPEFYSDGSFMSKPFQSLEILHFWNMPEWKEWSFAEGDGVFLRLKELLLEDCPKLNVHLPDSLPALIMLQVVNCKQLMPFLPRDQQMESAFPCLQVMKITGCPEQKSFLKGGLPSSLCSLSISFCDELKALDEGCLGILTSLKELEIHDCEKFPGLPIMTPSSLLKANQSESLGTRSNSRSGSARREGVALIEVADSSSSEGKYREGETPEDSKVAEITTAQARGGNDIQDIPWERLSIKREEYRQKRLEQYRNYENVPFSGESSRRDCKITEKGSTYYKFRQNVRLIKPSIHHFQLRNLVWATSKHDVYLNSHSSIIHWSSLTSSRSEVLNISKHVAPSERHPGSLLEGFTRTQLSMLAAKDELLVVAGFQGELICKRLDWPGVSYCSRTTYDDNAITNSIEIYESPSGALHFLASSNDRGVREFNMDKFQLSKHFRFPWAVNNTSLSPDGKLLVVVGDNPDGLLVDSQTGKTVTAFHGHFDYSFASAWHPNGVTFATGNQDKTCRIWDARNLSKSVDVLRGNLAAIRSIRFTSDGCHMAMAEPADFVHVFDVKSGYEREQEIDFFGEIAGISFSPDTESLFIGVSDRTYGGLMEYGRHQNFT